MLRELGETGKRGHVHRYYRERESRFSLLKFKAQAIASPFSEYISHLQTVQPLGGNRSGVLPPSHPAAFESHQIPTYSCVRWDDLERKLNSKPWAPPV